jgi:hypothetical protein
VQDHSERFRALLREHDSDAAGNARLLRAAWAYVPGWLDDAGPKAS